MNADAGVQLISLLDNTGKLIRSVSGTSFIVFNVKGLANGNYFVQFDQENGDQYRKKVIINQ